MIPSFSIMGISREYEDMAKKSKATRWFGGSRKEIDSLVLQLSTICNQACEELVIEYNNIKNKKLMKTKKNKTIFSRWWCRFSKVLRNRISSTHWFYSWNICNGELCLANLAENKPDVIILDYHLDGIDKNAMNRIETLE
jgi:hypothetical protein